MLRKLTRGFYWELFWCAVIVALAGVCFVFSAAYGEAQNLAFRQLVWFGIGLVALFVVVAIGYRSFLNVSYVLYGIAILLLLAVDLLGATRLGAQRWISVGGFGIQPSELCKLAMILTLAHYLGSRVSNLYQFRRFVGAFLLVSFPMLLIIKQPDLGTALIFMPILFVMLFMWGARFRYLLGSMALGLISLPVFWLFLKEYQRRRLLVFLNPNIDPLGSGYTAIQSKIAVGSGGLLGKGWLMGTQNRLNFLPEHHTDFIFCVIAEEWGFIGSLILIFLYGLLVWRSLAVIERTTDPPARLLASGIVAMIFFQILVNVGMTIGLMPVVGIPLPFVSYGGSSLVVMMIAMGFLISIYKERSIF